MPARFKVTTRDRGRKKFDESMLALKRRPGVTVGVHADEGAKAHPQRDANAQPETILDVALWNEFGLGVPERSWLRAWFDETRAQNNELALRQLRLVVTGKITPEVALEQLGAVMVGQIQKRIAEGISPPNAASTIAAKGSAVPLIDEGTLRQSITFLLTKR